MRENASDPGRNVKRYPVPMAERNATLTNLGECRKQTQVAFQRKTKKKKT